MKERFEKRYNLIKEGHNQEIDALKEEVNQLHERLENIEIEIEVRNPENAEYKELTARELAILDLENASIDERAKAAKRVTRKLSVEKSELEAEKTQIILELADKEPILNKKIEDYENKVNNINKINSVAEMQDELDYHALNLEKDLETIENEIKEHEEKYNNLDAEKKELEAKRKSLNEEKKTNVKIVKDNKKAISENLKEEDALAEREKANEENIKKLKVDVLAYLDNRISENAEKRIKASGEEKEKLEAEFNENNEFYKKVLSVEGDEFLSAINTNIIIGGMGTDIDSLFTYIGREKEKINNERKQIAVDTATLNHEISKLEDRTVEIFYSLEEIDERKKEITAEKAIMRNDKRKLDRKKNSILREYNDCRNKSARCDLVIGRLLDGEKWDDISVKLEGFKNKDYTCAEKISERNILPVSHIAVIEDEEDFEPEPETEPEPDLESDLESEQDDFDHDNTDEGKDKFDLDDEDEIENHDISESAFAVLDNNVNAIAESQVRKAKLESEHMVKGNIFKDFANDLSDEIESQAEKQNNEKTKKKGFFAKLFDKIFRRKSKDDTEKVLRLEEATASVKKEETEKNTATVESKKENDVEQLESKNPQVLRPIRISNTVVKPAAPLLPNKPKTVESKSEFDDIKLPKEIKDGIKFAQKTTTVSEKESDIPEYPVKAPVFVKTEVSGKPMPITKAEPTKSSRNIDPNDTTRTILSKLDPEDRKIILGEDANIDSEEMDLDENKPKTVRENNEITQVFVDEMIKANEKKFNNIIGYAQNEGIEKAKLKVVSEKKQREEEKERKKLEKIRKEQEAIEAEKRKQQEELEAKQRAEKEELEAEIRRRQEELEAKQKAEQEALEEQQRAIEAERKRKIDLKEGEKGQMFRNKYKVEAVNNSRKVVEAHRDAKTWSKYASNDEERKNLYVNNSMKKNNSNLDDERE